MANDEFGERTEQPTDRRRQEAREKGNVARSTDLTGAGLMLAVAVLILTYGASVSQSLAEVMSAHLRGPAWVNFDGSAFVLHARRQGELLAGAVLPMMLLLAGAVLAGNLGQVGFLISPESIQPKWSHLNPIAGAQRILSMQALMKLGSSLGKLLIVTILAALGIMWSLPRFLELQGVDWALDLSGSAEDSLRNLSYAEMLFQELTSSVGWLGVQIASGLLVLALLDYGFQRYRLEQSLRMTKQEVRDEMKNMEGDPLTRQRRREAHRKLAQSRELQAVKHADVVITNPTHIAVAIRYKPKEMAAPTVVAKGMGEIAHRIRQIAAESGVPIIERKPLARALYRDVKVGRPIPLEMYEVFVEIMAYVYRLTGKKLE